MKKEKKWVKLKNNFQDFVVNLQQKLYMKRFLNIGLALLFYLYVPCSYCQTSRFFSSDHLSSTMISSACITQDSEGYIWIGTEYGLNRYDGYRFTCYLNDTMNPAAADYNLRNLWFK